MSKLVLPVAALAFCTWAVSLAGVASLQKSCQPGWSNALQSIDGFSGGLPCHRLFRYSWFIVCLEVALLVMVAIAAASGFFQRSRASWVGLFSIATLLYIQMSNTYLAAEDTFKLGNVQDRSRTMTAGSIMTAVANCILIIVMGVVDGDAPAPSAPKDANAV